jgi:hypothetical protein
VFVGGPNGYLRCFGARGGAARPGDPRAAPGGGGDAALDKVGRSSTKKLWMPVGTAAGPSPSPPASCCTRLGPGGRAAPPNGGSKPPRALAACSPHTGAKLSSVEEAAPAAAVRLPSPGPEGDAISASAP